MECSIHDVTPGVPRKACWGEFSIVCMGAWPKFGQLLLRVQGKYRAALTPILDQSSSIDLFNSGRPKLEKMVCQVIMLEVESVVCGHHIRGLGRLSM